MTVYVGFTGTRGTLTPSQAESLGRVIAELPHSDMVAWHGDCVGGDDLFDEIVSTDPRFRLIVSHPPEEKALRAFCHQRRRAKRREVVSAKPYLVRNREIAQADVLIAAPAGPEVTRSGTWATVRYARGRKDHPRIIIVMPNGEIVR